MPISVSALLGHSLIRHIHRLMHWLSLRIQPREYQHLVVLSVYMDRLQGEQMLPERPRRPLLTPRGPRFTAPANRYRFPGVAQCMRAN